VRVEAFGVRRSCLCGDVFGILEGSRPRQLTMQIAPSFGFGARDRRVRACIRFSRRHRQMIPKEDGAVTRLWQTPIRSTGLHIHHVNRRVVTPAAIADDTRSVRWILMKLEAK
jgi:hypothetical protein